MIVPTVVEQVRSASRTMVRELGVMRTTLAGTGYSPSAVHTLLELGEHSALTATQLVQELGLEKSSVSRMVAKLIQSGELKESQGEEDGRTKQLSLTEQGKRTLEEIHAYGQMQVWSALVPLTQQEQQTIAQGLNAYAQALKTYRQETVETTAAKIRITFGYRPGLIGRMAEMHASFYSRHSGFGQFFESQVATGVAEFAGRLNSTRNAIWVAESAGRIVGSLAIDGEDLGNDEAHLRWFILDDGCRGGGIGRHLLTEAVDFCDRQNFSAIKLWTFKGLEAARRLYESLGFELTHEEQGNQWGTAVTEQQFTRKR
ncbi:bifunctional helix-turn-helix transcriptional regulator/GNAT family N-acetyltransferase [Xanthomonas arboricola]|uniref:bifunctional helix-turn-helix transcriptional regulator/GNAT family N-acetyltransferase n=1 Tax=Xanthomonas arboricola TaxID=56448 RepID=UPI00069F8339|nr:bifunctional helix-turn-helix transcriptional regulator/GNAT family N-acetyltransferase [Xanthomonas arboricola]AKU48466.1 MarR family transcriptional regulator [Xanthomonas arboricola pv. juglandis]KOB28520.1 MarR family transcriptional regulator [Xanthomonas arboricola]KOB45770.1 MarR family transcriptional regulator [Xanthomonas arboricola]MEA5149866.1 bifunctional helix-turn-helix transcriptional regulator/GNAT family N-acetyltransferase [Xanthomonas arboricola]UQP98367.1 bifunctional h